MKTINKIFFGIIGIALLPFTFLLSLVLTGKLEATRKQEREDLFEQEEEQFTEMKIKLKATADPKKAEVFKIDTDFGKTELIRWNKKNKKVVVFVHGVMCDKMTSAKAVKLWSDNGYDVVSFDGYGWGTTRQYGLITKYAGKEQAKLLDDVINAVLNKYKLKEIMLHGESMGGGTIYRYIQKYGTSKLEKIVSDAGFLSFYENVRYLAAEVVTTPVSYMVAPVIWIPFLFKGYPIRRQISKKALANIDKELLHIHSTDDIRVPYPYIKSEVKNFKGKAKIWFYKKDVRHVRGYYDSPKELEKTIKDFVKL